MNMEAYGTRLHGRDVLVLRVPLDRALVAEDSARTWIHCAVEGTWEGHPSGAFTFDREVFAGILANFKAGGQPLPLTYEHPKYGDGQPKPAAGWIHDLEIRADGMWALIEFTERGAGFIRAGEYRYCSVVVDFSSTDRKTAEEIGPELFEIGLTNSPFLSGLTPIALSRRSTAPRKASATRRSLMKINSKEILAALGDSAEKEMDADKFLELVQAEVAKLKALEEPEKPKAEEKPEAPAAEASVAPVVSASAEAPAVAASAEVAANYAAPVEEPAAMAADAGAAEMLLAKLCELSGMDAAGVMATISDNPDAFAALFGKAPESGTPADAGAMSANGEATALGQIAHFGSTRLDLARATAELSAVKKQHAADVQKLSAKIKETEDALSAAEDGKSQIEVELNKIKDAAIVARVDKAANDGWIWDTEHSVFLDAARTVPDKFENWMATRDPAQGGKPVVPVGMITAATKTGESTDLTRKSVSGEGDVSDIDPKELALWKSYLRHVPGLSGAALTEFAASSIRKNREAELSKSARNGTTNGRA